MSKHIELARKLKALADRGIGGEKLNAENMLKDLMRKHKITLADIDGETTQDFFFKLKEEDVRMFMQIVAVVNLQIKHYGPFPAKKIREYRLEGNYMITCTYAESIEIDAMFNFYKDLYKNEEDLFFHAFCNQNDLLIEAKKRDSPPTKEELDKWFKIEALAQNIAKENFRKQIASKTEKA